MSIYGIQKILFKTSIRGDKLIVNVLTKNKQFLRFLKNNIDNGSYIVKWYKEKQDRFEFFERRGCRSASQVYSQAHSYFGLLIRDYIKYFSQNKVEYYLKEE